VGDRTVVFVGFAGAALAAAPADLPPGSSVMWIEEPDIVRKRSVRELLKDAPIVSEIVEWEHCLPGKAEEFHAAFPDLEPIGVIPLTEYATPFAARLAECYGLPGASFAAASAMRDKAQLRRITGAAGIRNPESVEVRDAAEVLEFLRAGSGPVILKPANRQGSVGVRVIEKEEDVEQAWAACIVQDEGVLVPDRGMELRMLAERFVAGDEFSVEMLVRDGEPVFENVTGKQLFPGPWPVESAHIVPALIGDDLRDLLCERTRRVLAAVGFRDGIVHCEWIVADGEPHLVECAGRWPGDGIMELIKRAYPVDLIRGHFAILTGDPLPADLPKTAAGGAAVRFFVPSLEKGVVAAVHGVEEATKAEGVMVCGVGYAVGDRYDGVRNSWDREAYVGTTADSPAEALRLADAAVAMIRIELRAR
jgi:biotin carboxylase